jgi:hypothetical protein
MSTQHTLIESPRRFRIRHCVGNEAAWALILLRPDGTESDSYGSYTTSFSLDALLKNAGHLTPASYEHVELIP